MEKERDRRGIGEEKKKDERGIGENTSYYGLNACIGTFDCPHWVTAHHTTAHKIHRIPNITTFVLFPRLLHSLKYRIGFYEIRQK